MKLIATVGKKFNKLIILEKIGKYGTDNIFLCKCDCGNTREVRGSSLTSGNTKSCGCINHERIVNLNRTRVRTYKKHGLCRTRIYSIWAGVKQRCLNKKKADYKYYGGRGITMDKRWIKFEEFYKDMSEGYKDDLTIDRIDNSKGYFKENCKWSTFKEQANNRRNENIGGRSHKSYKAKHSAHQNTQNN